MATPAATNIGTDERRAERRTGRASRRAVAILAGALCCGAGASASAATLELRATPVGPIASTYDPERGRGEDRQRFEVTAIGDPGGEIDRIELRGAAPPGSLWAVDPFEPSLLQAPALQLRVTNARVDPIPPTAEILDIRWLLLREDGSEWPLEWVATGAAVGLDPPAARLLVVSDFLVEPIEFVGFRLEIDLQPVPLAVAALPAFDDATLWFEYAAPEDPGARLALVPVPEPNATAMAAAVVVALRSLARRVRPA